MAIKSTFVIIALVGVFGCEEHTPSRSAQVREQMAVVALACELYRVSTSFYPDTLSRLRDFRVGDDQVFTYLKDEMRSDGTIIDLNGNPLIYERSPNGKAFRLRSLAEEETDRPGYDFVRHGGEWIVRTP